MEMNQYTGMLANNDELKHLKINKFRKDYKVKKINGQVPFR